MPSIYHTTLSIYFQTKPLYLDEPTQKKPNIRKLVELPWQQTLGEMWDEVTETLCDVFFIEARAKSEMLDLQQQEYFNILSLIINSENKECLNSFYNLFLKQKHIFRRHPELTFQQFYNELQWENGKARNIIEISKKTFLLNGNFFLHQYRIPYVNESRLIMTLSARYQEIVFCTFSPDSKLVVAGGNEDLLSLWDSETGKEIFSTSNNGFVFTCMFSSDFNRIIVANGSPFKDADFSLKHLNLETGVEITTIKLSGHRSVVNACAFSLNGKQILSGSNDGVLKLWDTYTGIEIMTLSAHKNGVTACAFSPDNKLLVSGSSDNTIKLWSSDCGRLITTLNGHNSQICSCSFSPDSKRIVSGSYDGILKIWDIATGKEIFTLTGHNNMVETCSFSPDGKLIVSGGFDKTVKLWNAEIGSILHTNNGHGNSVCSCAFSHNSKRIVSGSLDSTLKIWDVQKGKNAYELKAHENTIRSINFSMDNKQIVSGGDDGTIKIWDADIGEEICTFHGARSGVSGCSFSPDGKTVVSVCKDKIITIWEIGTNKKYMINSEYNCVLCNYSQDAKGILTVSGDILKFWDLDTVITTKTYKKDTNTVRWIILPDGKRVGAVQFSRNLKIWDSNTLGEIAVIPWYSKVAYFFAMSPDDSIAIISGEYVGTIKLLDIVSRREITTIEGHIDDIESCIFSPNGKWFVSISHDKTLRIWNTETGRILSTFISDASLYACTISGCGAKIACGDELGNLYLLRFIGYESLEPPVITGVRLWHFNLEDKKGKWDIDITSNCPYCGIRFPCNVPNYASWDDPRLLFECPKCKKKLKINPFVIDNNKDIDKVQLFKSFKANGFFAKAEDILFDLLKETNNKKDILDMGFLFYNELLKLDNEKLINGNLPRDEVLQSLEELIRKLKN